MFINDVENIVGLSKKSIRYYEENGLISPSRNSDNKYRNYSNEDIEKLKKIKLLRELGVPIKELKQLNENEYSLKECMEDRIHKINHEMEQYGKVKVICEEILASNDSFDSIDIEQYFQRINVLNKEGFSMKVEEIHRKKIHGAIYSCIGFSLFFLLMILLLVWAQKEDPMPIGLWIGIMAIFILPLCMLPFVLKQRIDEIKGGEEDEASQY